MDVMRQRFRFGMLDEEDKEEEEGFAMAFPNARAIYCHTFLSLQIWPFKCNYQFHLKTPICYL